MKKLVAAIFSSILSLCAFGLATPVWPQDAEFNDLEALRKEGRYAEAISGLKRAIANLQAQNKLESAQGAVLLYNLGELHYQLGLYAEAIPYYERSINLAQAGVPEQQLAITYRNLGIVYQLTGRSVDAISAYKASIAILSKFPGERVQLASTINNVATLAEELKRYDEAEKLLQQALGIYRAAFGENHLYVATAYNNLGELYEKTGDLTRAEPMLLTANNVMMQVLNRDHPRRVSVLRNLGALYRSKEDWPQAFTYYREALGILQKQSERSAHSRQGEPSAVDITPRLQKTVAGDFINASMKLLLADRSQGVALSREIFKVAQWRPSQTAASPLKMSARASADDDSLSGLLRKRQELVTEWQTLEQRLTQSALKEGDTAAQQAGASITRLDQIGGEISALDAAIASRFPDYADLTNPAPLDVSEVQALLRDDEALVLFVETDNPSWVWIVTKTEKSLDLINLSSDALATEVANFRCGLDQANWEDPSEWPETTPLEVKRKQTQKGVIEGCRKLGTEPNAIDFLPFDLDRANRLYQLFFGASEKAIEGKHLIIVPSQSLIQFPFAALVTEQPPPNVDLRDVKWLGTSTPISILPSVSSLRMLRRLLKPSKASKPFLGFGNPLLTGDPPSAERARSRQTCGAGDVRIADNSPRKLHAGFRLQPADAFRGGLGDIGVLKAQTALPETADELCDVARSLKASPDDVFLGERATETAFKNLNRSGRLAKYRVIHLATHGLVAGDLSGAAEPALLLTPPETATEDDDGLLTASEVSQMKMDATWVVLSACNTSSGGAEGAEALSGLAKAFFYAGSRALLVTHWELNSEAAVMITSAAFEAADNNPRLSQAETVRDAMAAAVRDEDVTFAAHPAIWAAFTLIGDGGRR